MPVSSQKALRRMSQEKFGAIAFRVMRHVFDIHSELGRFFDEKIYKRELANRMADVRLEEPIEVQFGSFRKTYFLDVLVEEGAVFEFKSVQALNRSHRAQPALLGPSAWQGHAKYLRQTRDP
jgi:GxxExxY protein